MPSEPCILGFDTSAAHCAAAVLSGDRVLAHLEEPMARGQAERLMPLLEDVLRAAGLGWHDLDTLAVGVGPGNFTGIRIAVSAARGLALGLGVPAIGITIFEARAEGLPRPLLVVEDARRGEVYLQRFDPDPEEPVLTALSGAGAFGTMAVAGSAATAWADASGAMVLAAHQPLAEAIARVAAQKVAMPQPRPAPLYIRPADAARSAEPAPNILA